LFARRSLENAFSPKIRPFFPTSILEHKGHLNTRNKVSKEVFPNPMIFLLILDELRNLGFGGTKRNP
jgi:hypothetical protein